MQATVLMNVYFYFIAQIRYNNFGNILYFKLGKNLPFSKFVDHLPLSILRITTSNLSCLEFTSDFHETFNPNSAGRRSSMMGNEGPMNKDTIKFIHKY